MVAAATSRWPSGRDVEELNADIHTAIRFGQSFRVTPGGGNPASGLADGEGNGPGDPAAPADDQHSLTFLGRHLFSPLSLRNCYFLMDSNEPGTLPARATRRLRFQTYRYS